MARRVVVGPEVEQTQIEAARDYIREAKSTLEQEKQELREVFYAYASWANTVSGARVLKHLKAETADLSYRPGRDGAETAFYEGRRSLVLDILANISSGQRLVVLGDGADAMTQNQADIEEDILAL